MIVIAAICVGLAGGSPNKAQPREFEEIAIMHVVFDAHFGIEKDVPDGILPIYLGVDAKDPSNDILVAFEQRYASITFYTFSQSKLNAEKKAVDLNTGRPAQNIEFSRVTWRKDTEAEIEIGWYCYPLFSGADLYILKKKGDDWIVASKRGIYRT